MKNILIFINSLGGGGAEKALINFLSILDPNEYLIYLVSLKGGVYESKIPQYVKYKKIIRAKNERVGNFLSKVLQHMPKKIFNKLFLNYKVDLKVAYMEGMPTKAIWFDKSCKTLSFVHCDVSRSNPLKPFYKSKTQCLNEYENFTRVCFVSESAKEGFFRSVGRLDNAAVVHNIVDVDDILQRGKERVELDYQTKGLKCIAVGRLSKEKGFLRLLEAICILEKIYSFELWILGEGPERSALEAIIEKKAIKSVKLIGFVSNPYPYIKKADLLVCSSFFEGYSTVANESLILGVPILTTECAGMNEITESGKYGFVVNNDDAALVGGLKDVLEHPEKIGKLKNLLNQKHHATNIEEYKKMLTEILGK